VLGPVHAVAGGGETDARPARERAINPRDGALLGRHGLANHPRQRPGPIRPQGDGYPVPPGRARPIIVTTAARDSMWGPTFPELVEALPGIEIIDRSSVNAFDDVRVARAIEATGRKKLIFAGISLEVCAAFPAITAVGRGLDAYVAVDASATFSETKRQVGLLRMLQAGVIVSDYSTLIVEILKDNARPEAGEVYGAMDMAWAKLVG
jgi:nicotinamidase-related amidase